MEIRLLGTSEEIEAAIKILCQHFEILSESHDEPNRNSSEDRKYLKVKFKSRELKPKHDGTITSAKLKKLTQGVLVAWW